MKLGIIGLGFVGNAIYQSFGGSQDDLWGTPVVTIDPYKGLQGSYPDLIGTDGVFICVPTPQDDDGTCDTSALEEVLAKLKAINYQGVVISKCTAPPSTYEQLQKNNPNLIHAPEFLTAANAVKDYVTGSLAIIGGNVKAYVNEAERIIRQSQRDLQTVIHCSIQEASLIKYAYNTFLATKVVFMNELYTIANASNCDYNVIANACKLDPRIGSTHLQVPGFDGAFGFGGACFPKDTQALLKYAEGLGLHLNVLDAAVKKNTMLRLTEPK